MSIIHRERETAHRIVGNDDSPQENTRAASLVAAGVRIALGWVFLWAFLDKAFGMGHDTVSKDAWVNGGSPTKGFLGFASAGPFQSMYHQIAGQAWADWLFMLGLAGIGTALILGIAMRLAGAAGALLLVLMWTAVLPPANNPFMDDHLIYAGALLLLVALKAGHTVGFGKVWEQLDVVRKYRALR